MSEFLSPFGSQEFSSGDPLPRGHVGAEILFGARSIFDEPMAEFLLEEVKNNDKLKYVIVAGRSAIGKSTLIDQFVETAERYNPEFVSLPKIQFDNERANLIEIYGPTDRWDIEKWRMLSSNLIKANDRHMIETGGASYVFPYIPRRTIAVTELLGVGTPAKDLRGGSALMEFAGRANIEPDAVLMLFVVGDKRTQIAAAQPRRLAHQLLMAESRHGQHIYKGFKSFLFSSFHLDFIYFDDSEESGKKLATKLSQSATPFHTIQINGEQDKEIIDWANRDPDKASALVEQIQIPRPMQNQYFSFSAMMEAAFFRRYATEILKIPDRRVKIVFSPYQGGVSIKRY